MTTFYFAMPVGWYMHDHELLYLLLYSFITSLSTSERKLDIGLHLAKLRTTDLNVNQLHFSEMCLMTAEVYIHIFLRTR